MKTSAIATIAVLLLFASAIALAATPSTTRTTDQLIGRWRVVSMGRFEVAPDKAPLWEFDGRWVTVTSDGTTKKSQYTLETEDEHQMIFLVAEGATDPDRIGWYEIKDNRLRLQLALGGKKPTRWSDETVFVFERIKK